jgi:hypothetical protein
MTIVHELLAIRKKYENSEEFFHRTKASSATWTDPDIMSAEKQARLVVKHIDQIIDSLVKE